MPGYTGGAIGEIPGALKQPRFRRMGDPILCPCGCLHWVFSFLKVRGMEDNEDTWKIIVNSEEKLRRNK